MSARPRLAVVGLGLIGGSVALAARRAGAAAHIAGYDPDPQARSAARQRGVVDRAEARLEDALAGADLVILAAPPVALLAEAERVAAAVPAGALVTDVASTKAAVVARYREALAGRAPFVGGHPLAGSERRGLDAARPDLFHGATWFLTPESPDERAAAARVARWLRRLGALPLSLPAAVHDALLAATSHLPQVAASALAAAVARRAAAVGRQRRPPLARLTGPGFRDATRLALSPPDLWVDIALTNADNIVGAVDALVAELQAFRGLLAARDGEGLRRWFQAAGAARRSAAAGPGEEPR